MRFVVHDAVLNADDEVLQVIDRLVDRLAEEVHEIEVPDADLLMQSAWYQWARPIRRKVLTTAVATPPRASRDGSGLHWRAFVLIDADSTKIADKLAYAPLVILVEDREADGELLDILVEELGSSELHALWQRSKRATPRAIKIDTAGGMSAIPKRVERAVADAVEESRPHRLFVICDSDARWPSDLGEPRGRWLAAIRTACAKYSVPLHIWEKRCAENYIPDQVFEAERDDPLNQGKIAQFNALLRRSRTQRDHFPIKDRLSPEERSQAITAGLYSDAESPDLALLENRLFARSPRTIQRLGKERRAAFTADGLRERDGNGEIEGLLHAIAQEL